MKQVFNLGLFVGKGEFGGGQTRHIIIMLLFEGRKDFQNLCSRVHFPIQRKGYSISGKIKQKKRRKPV
jgi:hypothetical protein